jgi:hypothetical protein
MRNIVIFAPFHFQKEELLTHVLNSIITEDSVLISYTSLPISRTIKGYAEE